MPGLLKRKRSESELSFSSTTTLSSPPRPAGSISWHGMSVDKALSPPGSRSVPLHLSSRTFKRCRSNRPSDEQVHQYTMDLLYSAQQPAHLLLQQQPPPSPVQPCDQFSTSVESARTSGTTVAHQSSLHNYWNIRGPAADPILPPVPAAAPMHQLYDHANPVCEDCGAAVGCDGDLCMMDIDGNANDSRERCCCACGKVVCFSCSVSNLGEQRRCLQCAGRKAWTGGIGWLAQ